MEGFSPKAHALNLLNLSIGSTPETLGGTLGPRCAMSQATLLLPEFHPCLLCEAIATPRRQPNSSACAVVFSLLGHLAPLCGYKLNRCVQELCKYPKSNG